MGEQNKAGVKESNNCNPRLVHQRQQQQQQQWSRQRNQTKGKDGNGGDILAEKVLPEHSATRHCPAITS